MKFNIQQTELNTALQHLVRNTENKFPVFSNIEIKSVDNKLELLASNGTITYKELVSADIEENTPIAIPAQKFYEIVSRLNNLICFKIRLPNVILNLSATNSSSLASFSSDLLLSGFSSIPFLHRDSKYS